MASTSPEASTASRPGAEDPSRADVYARLSSALAFPDSALHARVAADEWPAEIAAELVVRTDFLEHLVSSMLRPPVRVLVVHGCEISSAAACTDHGVAHLCHGDFLS